jgi:hypothetical protein
MTGAVSHIVKPHIVSRISYIESQIPFFVAFILFSDLERAVYDIRNTLYDIQVLLKGVFIGIS